MRFYEVYTGPMQGLAGLIGVYPLLLSMICKGVSSESRQSYDGAISKIFGGFTCQPYHPNGSLEEVPCEQAGWIPGT